MNAYQRNQLALARQSVSGVPGVNLVGLVPITQSGWQGGGMVPHQALQALQSGQALGAQAPVFAGAAAQQIQVYAPTQTNRFPFPMPQTSLAAGASGTSAANAQVPTKPQRLIMTESTGPTSLTDITIGVRPQFAALTGNFPIAAFGATATDSMVNFDTAQTGQAIVLSLTNGGASATVVVAGFLADIAV